MDDQACVALQKMPLPLVAHTNRWAMLRIGAFAGAAAAVCIPSAIALGAGLLGQQFKGETITVLLGLAAGVITGFCFLGVAFCCVVEALHRSPRLVVETAKIRDDRSRMSVSWSSVASVRPLHARSGIAALRFELKEPIAARYNPFLPGSPSLFRRRKPHELHISVVGLDVCPDALAATVIDLVRHHGGVVEPRRPLW